MKSTHKEIDKWINSLTSWQADMCKTLRKTIHDAIPDGYEDWKWGPNFKNKEGVMVANIWSFEKHVGLIFFQGAQIKDKYKLFTDGHDNQFMRTIKFFGPEDLDDKKLKQIREYLEIAKGLEKLKHAKKPKQPIVVPDHYEKILKENNLWEKFNELSYTRQKDHILSVTEAKQETTRQKRIEKSLDRIREGLGFWVD